MNHLRLLKLDLGLLDQMALANGPLVIALTGKSRAIPFSRRVLVYVIEGTLAQTFHLRNTLPKLPLKIANYVKLSFFDLSWNDPQCP
jgi:hypothetical protein